MKPNTIIQLPDGRKATVVYHGLDGYGIVFGVRGPYSEDDLPHHEAMLRESYPHALRVGLECVGETYQVLADFKNVFPCRACGEEYEATDLRYGRCEGCLDTFQRQDLEEQSEQLIGGA